MSERLSVPLPKDLRKFNEIQEQVYINGAQHYRGVEPDGTKIPIPGDKILESYGYDPSLEPSDFDPIPNPADFKTAEVAAKPSYDREPIGRGISSKGKGGLHDMTAAYEKKLEEKLAAEALEKRASSPEVSEMNSLSELQIFGSRGRTIVDPSTGKVIADKGNPIKSRVERIMEGSGTQKERTERAQEYTDGINELLDAKYELTQADFLMGLRLQDKVNSRKLVAKLITNDGMDPAKASEKAAEVYAAKDAKRLEIVKNNGYMTMGEYKAHYDKPAAAAASTDDKKALPPPPIPPKADKPLPPPDPNAKPVVPARKATPLPAPTAKAQDAKPWPAPNANKPTAKLELTPDQRAELTELLTVRDEARTRLIEANAKRRKNHISGKKELIKATEEYSNALSLAGFKVAQLMRDAGFEEKDILAASKLGAIEESRMINQEGLVLKQEELAVKGRFIGAFTNAWTRWSEPKENGKRNYFGKLKKVGTIVGIGFAAGATLGAALPLLGLGAGALLPAGLMGRFAKGQAVGKLQRNVAYKTQAQAHNNSVHSENIDKFMSADSILRVKDVLEGTNKKTGDYVKQNRLRALGSAVLGGTASLVPLSLMGNMPSFNMPSFGFLGSAKDSVGEVADLTGEGVEGVARELNIIEEIETPETGEIPTGDSEIIDNPEITVDDDSILNDGDSAEVVETAETEGNIEDNDTILSDDDIIENPDEVLPQVTPEQTTAEIDSSGAEIMVEPGNGFVSEIEDFAQANNYDVSSDRALELYQQGLEKFGKDGLITGETYEISPGNIGISASGTTSLTPQFEQFLLDGFAAETTAQLPGTL